VSARRPGPAVRGRDAAAFARAGHERWFRLEQVLDRAENAPARALGPAALRELLALYRQASADLSEARTIVGGSAVVAKLNDLTGRAYRCIYRAPRGARVRDAVARFFDQGVPGAFRRRHRAVVAALLLFVLGTGTGFLAVLARPDDAVRLVPAQFWTESPRERVETIENSPERISTVQEAAAFGAQLYTHNIQVSFLAFALGAATVVGGAWLLFYNGVILGAIAALYLIDGVHVFFLAWVGPHGALELPAIMFSGAAGFVLGRAYFLPGDRSLSVSLREAMPDVLRMLGGVVAMLVLAGLVEGSFSQFTARAFPYALKIGVAALELVLLVAYLFLRPLPEERA